MGTKGADAASRPDDDTPAWTRDDIRQARAAQHVVADVDGAMAADGFRRGRGRPETRKADGTRLDAMAEATVSAVTSNFIMLRTCAPKKPNRISGLVPIHNSKFSHRPLGETGFEGFQLRPASGTVPETVRSRA